MDEDYSYFQDKEFLTSLAAYERMMSCGEYVELDPEMLTDIAEYYAMNQRMDEANLCIKFAVSFYPDSVSPQVFLARQQMFYGNQAEAWRICNAISDQNDREVTFLRAEIHFHFNESEKAFRLLYKGYEEADAEEAPDFMYDSIGLCKDYGFGDKALEWVRLLRSDFPDYVEAIALQAEIHNYRHEYQEAKSLMEANIELMPYSIHAWLQLAEANLWLDDFDAATEAAEYALAIDSNNAEALMMRANILFDTDHFEEAHELYTRFLSYFPNDEKANFLDAESLVGLEQYEAAISRFEKLANLPGYAMKGYTLAYLAYCHAQLGHEEQSLHYRRQAEKERINNLPDLFPGLYPSSNDSPNCPTDEDDDLPF